MITWLPGILGACLLLLGYPFAIYLLACACEWLWRHRPRPRT